MGGTQMLAMGVDKQVTCLANALLLVVEPNAVDVSVVDAVVATLSLGTATHRKLTKRKLKLFLVQFGFGVKHRHSERLNAVKKSLLASSRGVRSPMEKVEPVILKFALWKQEAGQPITSGEGIELATSLIKDTPVELEVQQFQKSRHGKDTWCLTNSYW
jgi:hypothetical protein